MLSPAIFKESTPWVTLRQISVRDLLATQGLEGADLYERVSEQDEVLGLPPSLAHEPAFYDLRADKIPLGHGATARRCVACIRPRRNAGAVEALVALSTPSSELRTGTAIASIDTFDGLDGANTVRAIGNLISQACLNAVQRGDAFWNSESDSLQERAGLLAPILTTQLVDPSWEIGPQVLESFRLLRGFNAFKGAREWRGDSLLHFMVAYDGLAPASVVRTAQTLASGMKAAVYPGQPAAVQIDLQSISDSLDRQQLVEWYRARADDSSRLVGMLKGLIPGSASRPAADSLLVELAASVARSAVRAAAARSRVAAIRLSFMLSSKQVMMLVIAANGPGIRPISPSGNTNLVAAAG